MCLFRPAASLESRAEKFRRLVHVVHHMIRRHTEPQKEPTQKKTKNKEPYDPTKIHLGLYERVISGDVNSRAYTRPP